jgi:hypothetical protein
MTAFDPFLAAANAELARDKESDRRFALILEPVVREVTEALRGSFFQFPTSIVVDSSSLPVIPKDGHDYLPCALFYIYIHDDPGRLSGLERGSAGRFVAKGIYEKNSEDDFHTYTIQKNIAHQLCDVASVSVQFHKPLESGAAEAFQSHLKKRLLSGAARTLLRNPGLGQ